MNKLISTKNRVLFSLVGPSETEKLPLLYNWLKIATFQPKFDKIYFFCQHSQLLYDVMQKEIENLGFVRGVKVEFIDSLKNNGTKYLLIFDDSCEKICNSKGFVDIATAGRHRGLSSNSIKHNFFHQRKLGRDVELQHTPFVLFKPPRDVMQVTTLGAQVGLGSELNDWYRDATSVSFGHLLVDLSPRTDDRLRYCTNKGSVPSKFNYPEILKHLRTLDDKHTEFLYSPSVPIAFPQMQKSLSSVFCLKEFIRFLCECIVNLLKGNLQTIKRHHVVKFQGDVWLLLLKRTTWKQRRNVLLSEKGLKLIAVTTFPVNIRLTWYGAVCFCPSFGV